MIHDGGKSLTAGGETDYKITGVGENRQAEIFATLNISFDEETGIADEWDYSVVYICRTATAGHECIYFDF